MGVVNNRRDPDWKIPTERQEVRALLVSQGVNPDLATKSNLIDRYRVRLIERTAWAREDRPRLEKFLGIVWKTLNGGNALDRSSEIWKLALADVGLPPKVTLMFLHQLPHGG